MLRSRMSSHATISQVRALKDAEEGVAGRLFALEAI